LTTLFNDDIVSGSGDNTIKIWDSTDGSPKLTLTGHTNFVRFVTTLPNDDIVSGSSDNSIRIWDSTDGTQKLILNTLDVFAVTTLSNGDKVSGSFDESIRICDSTDATQKLIPNGHAELVRTVASLSNDDLVSGSNNKTIIHYFRSDTLHLAEVIHSAVDFKSKIQQLIVVFLLYFPGYALVKLYLSYIIIW
jgi:WD40 repeat protein